MYVPVGAAAGEVESVKTVEKIIICTKMPKNLKELRINYAL